MRSTLLTSQTLFSIFLARSANLRLDKVSSALILAGETLQIMTSAKWTPAMTKENLAGRLEAIAIGLETIDVRTQL